MGIDIEKPIAVGVLKIKAKIGELLPAGKVGAGRGNKMPEQPVDFNPSTIAAYRKIFANKAKIEEYAESADDVPFARFRPWASSGRY